MNEGNAFIYHLAEGSSEKLLGEYTDLEEHGLLREKLVGIHWTLWTAITGRHLAKKESNSFGPPLVISYFMGKLQM